MVKAKLPWPPSVNHYWCRGRGGHMFIGEKGREYRNFARLAMTGHAPLEGPVWLTVQAFPPDNRRRDLDNILKCILDSFEHAGAYADDSQVKHIDARMFQAVKGTPGYVFVTLEAM